MTFYEMIIKNIVNGSSYQVRNYKGCKGWTLTLEADDNGDLIIYDEYYMQRVDDCGGVEGLIDAIIKKQVKGIISLKGGLR